MNNDNPAMPYVLKGAKILDEKFPGWHYKVNLNILKFDSLEYCIIGQVIKPPFGQFAEKGLGRLFSEINRVKLWEKAKQNGFEAKDGILYCDIEEAWREVINRRKDSK